MRTWFPVVFLAVLVVAPAGAAGPTEELTPTTSPATSVEAGPVLVAGDSVPDGSFGPRLSVDVAYVLWWLREGRLPPTLTTSSPSSHGLLGQPDTRILYGGDRLETRHDNLGAALSWLVDTGQIGPAVQLIWATWRFWWLHGHAEELVRYVDQIVAHSHGMSSHQRALALSGAGFVRFVSGDQGQEVGGMPVVHVPPVGAVAQALQGVSPDGLEQAEPGLLLAGLHFDQAAVHQRAERVHHRSSDPVAADGRDGGQAETSGEHAEPAEQCLFVG